MPAWRSVRDETRMAVRLLTGLGRFFRAPLTAAECRARLAQSLASRDMRFLALLRRGVYERAESPYLPLLRRAGITYGDLERLAGDVGVEGALERLYDAGVHVTLDEFKGRRPIQRAGVEVPTAGGAFDNPFLTAHYESQSSGSRGPGSRLIVDLDLLEHEACYERQFVDDFGLMDRPKILWRMTPPGAAGLKMALRLARIGGQYDQWFSQTPISFRKDPKHALFVRAIAATARRHGRALPMPEYLPVSEAVTIARWLAERRAAGTPAFLNTSVSCAVRVCAAALRDGLDIRDTFIGAGGEPLSPGKVKVIASAGCILRANYSMAEVGRMGAACGRPSGDDDVHLLTDKLAVVQREAGRDRAPALWLTTLHWSAPKIMLNVELGDCGVLERRRCGCPWETLGFPWHLTTIRSYEKLTSEGMHFVGADLLALVEDVLPARFGGDATDYQLVEEEQDGLTRVSLLVSPRVGPLDEAAVRAVALEALASSGLANRMMAGVWQDSGTLRVVRREPYITRTGKIQTLHVAQPMAGVS